MLYPQINPFRQVLDLSGFWEIRFDPEDEGRAGGWDVGFREGQPIAVPASWNDQLADWRDFLGPAWYQTSFDLPWGWDASRVWLRFGSVNYLAEVWLNGLPLGGHEGGHLPFEFDLTDRLFHEGNLLVVRVDGALAPDHVPPGNVELNPLDTFPNVVVPAATFDFFPYCGIQRPVLLYAMPEGGLADLTVVTGIEELTGPTGTLQLRLERGGDDGVRAQVRLAGHGAEVQAQLNCRTSGEVALRVPGAALWEPGAPNLYELTVELLRDDVAFDRYTLQIGIRTFEVAGDQLLLNGKPVYLTGFGRHEDFPVYGRGLVPPVVIKDYALLEWVGANSFRTSHYPYSEQMMDLADRLGYLVIDETPAVGLFFREEGLERRLELCRQYTRELIARDKNHPSVIMWSLANEPHSRRPPAAAFFRDLYDLAKSLDPSRPATIVSNVGLGEEAFAFCDVVCVNRYNGWYTQPARLERGIAALSADLDAIHARYPKPMLLGEFGADAIAGLHAEPAEMFSEEYQAELIMAFIELLRSKSYVVGEHVWNLCDFKTGQAIHRIGGINMKGVFTRDRRPKLAAHRLRARWRA
jgi:beta-glucuronidase